MLEYATRFRVVRPSSALHKLSGVTRNLFHLLGYTKLLMRALCNIFHEL